MEQKDYFAANWKSQDEFIMYFTIGHYVISAQLSFLVNYSLTDNIKPVGLVRAIKSVVYKILKTFSKGYFSLKKR